jgi:methionyl-tRNA formyltransferase
MIAIGRSNYLFDAINHLESKGYHFKAIITEEAYNEYEVKVSDFQDLAAKLGIPCFVTRKVNAPEIVALIKEKNIQVAISVNWKYTLPGDFLDLFPGSVLNFHIGNLPDYKGNATPNWTIINGEDHINANVHKMDIMLDAGDIVSRKSIPITKDTYVADIIKEAEKLAPSLFEEAVAKISADPSYYLEKGKIEGMRCYPRLPEDSQIDWNTDIDTIYKLIRASSRPFNGAYTYLNGEKVTIWRAKPIESPGPYLAVPGHIVAVDKKENYIVVACKGGLLAIEEIELKQGLSAAVDYIKSIRLRFKNIPDLS